MRQRFGLFMILFPVLCLVLTANLLDAQEHFLTVTGTVVAIQGGARKWLEVKNEKDDTPINFRIGRNTTYVPQRVPAIGEKVRVMYYIEKGVPIATKVLIFTKE